MAVLAKCYLQIVRKVADIIPLCHLLLCERASNHSLGVFVEPLTLGIGSSAS